MLLIQIQGEAPWASLLCKPCNTAATSSSPTPVTAITARVCRRRTLRSSATSSTERMSTRCWPSTSLAQPGMQQARHVRRVGHQFGQALAQFLQRATRAVALDQDAFEHRPRHRPDIQLRVELAADAFDIEQGLLQQDQLRLQRQLVALGHAEQLEQYLGQGDLRQRTGEVRLADRTCRRFEFVDTHVGGHPARFDVQLGDTPVVAVEDGHEVLGQVVLIFLRELAHDAEVQRDEARIESPRRVAIDPDVAGVRIGMEEVVAEYLGVEHPHALGRQRLAVDAGGIQGENVVRRDAVHPFERERALAGVAPDHFRHVQIVGVQPETPQHAGVGALALQVELGGQRAFDLGYYFARADLVGARVGAVDQRGQRLEQRDGGVDLLFDRRPQHLDHHLAAFVQRGRMYLGDRGRGQRRGIETGEGHLDRLPQRLLDDPPRRFAVERLHAVLQQRQLIGHIRWHQIAAGREDLPELDEDRPQFLQRQAQTGTSRLRRDRGRGARHERLGQAQPAFGRRAFEQIIEAVAQHDLADTAGAEHRLHGVLPRAQPRHPGSQTLGVVAQLIDIIVECLELGPRHHVARLLGHVFGGIASQAGAQVARGAQCALHGLGDLHAEHFTEHGHERQLPIGIEARGQMLQAPRQLGIAGHAQAPTRGRPAFGLGQQR